VGALLDPERRRRAREARRERKEAILSAAADLVRTCPLTELTLEAVDRHAGFQPGLASMYFGDLPGLLLALVRRELGAALEAATAACAPPARPEAVVRALARVLAGRPLLARLLAAAPVLLETREADPGVADLFERWHLEALRATAARIAAVCPELGQERAFTLLRRAETLAAALAREIDPRSWVLLARNDPELAVLHPDPEEELAALLLASLGRA